MITFKCAQVDLSHRKEQNYDAKTDRGECFSPLGIREQIALLIPFDQTASPLPFEAPLPGEFNSTQLPKVQDNAPTIEADSLLEPTPFG